MSVEAALKAVLVSRTPVATRNGKLPDELKSHDLAELAARLSFTGEDQHERDAFRDGREYIEAIGRYPTPTDATHAPVSSVTSVGRLFEAYARLYSRLVREIGVEPEFFEWRADAVPGTQRAWDGVNEGFVLTKLQPSEDVVQRACATRKGFE